MLTCPRLSPAVSGRVIDAERLALQIRVHRFFPELTPPAGLLVAAERHGRIEDAMAVDPDGAGAQLWCEREHLVDIARPDAGREPVDRGIREARYLGEVLEGLRHDDGAENLLTHDRGFIPSVGEHRGLDVVAGGLRRAATGRGARPAREDRKSVV